MLQKHCLWDTVSINWDNMQILKHDIPVVMPVTVTVPLTHKIKMRNILSTEFDIQVTLKKGNDRINITQWTAKKQSNVIAMCAVLHILLPTSTRYNKRLHGIYRYTRVLSI